MDMDPVLVERARSRINSIRQQLLVVPPGRFFEDPDYLDTLLPQTVLHIQSLVELISSDDRVAKAAAMLSMFAENSLMATLPPESPDESKAAHMEMAIALGALSLKCIPADDPLREQGKIISVFGRILKRNRQLYPRDGTEQLDDLVYFFGQAVRYGHDADPMRPFHYDDLGFSLLQRFALIGMEDDFAGAAAAFNRAVSVDQLGAAPVFLCNLGRLYGEKAVKLKSIVWAKQSIETHQDALARLSDAYRGSICYLYRHLAKAYSTTFELDGDLTNLDVALKWLRKAEDICDRESGHDRFDILDEQAAVYRLRFLRTQNLEDANLSVEIYRAPLGRESSNLLAMDGLSGSLRQLFDLIRDKCVLTEAIQVLEDVIIRTPMNAPELVRRIRRIAELLSLRYEIGHEFNDLDTSVELYRLAVALPCRQMDEAANCLRQFSTALAFRFEAAENTVDLRDSEEAVKKAIELRPSPQQLGECFWQYGRVFMIQYDVSRDEEILSNGIDMFLKALETFPKETGARAYALSDCAGAYLRKFEHKGLEEDSANAVAMCTEAIEIIEKDPTAEAKDRLAMYTHNLGNAHLARFTRWNVSEEIDQAITCYRRCMEVADDAELYIRAMSRAGSLSHALQARYQKTKNPRDIREAMEVLEEATAKPVAHQLSPKEKLWIESKAGMVYLTLFLANKDDAGALEKAILHLRRACAIPTADKAYIFCPNVNLALALLYHAKRTNQDLDYAAAALQYVISYGLLSEGDPYAYGFMRNFAAFALELYERDQRPFLGFGQLALTIYVKLSEETLVFPEIRVFAAMYAGKLHVELHTDFSAARDSLKMAARMLPESILLMKQRQDLLRLIKQSSWLPENLASISLCAGDSPADALQAFEGCRSILWNQVLARETGAERLRGLDLSLAEEYEKLQGRLGQPAELTNAGVVPNPSSSREIVSRHHAATRYASLVDAVRQLEGFEDFLTLSQETLTQYARTGPIIALNITEYRADALINTCREVLSVPLRVTLREAMEHAVQFKILKQKIRGELEGLMEANQRESLWLWEAIAEPILNTLGITGESKRSRIWWLMCGWTDLLPIHAAGDHERAMQTSEHCTVLDRAISSYIPTIKTLEYARKIASGEPDPPHEDNGRTPTVVLTMMPVTPGASALPQAEQEVRVVKALLETSHKILMLDQPTGAQVLSALPQASIAHFSCHGTAHEDPLRSQLLFKDCKKKNTPKVDVRSLLDLTLGRHRRLKLVFLSACETATNRDLKLMNETLHISGAFQMAGVPHVVGTLWEISDFYAVELAEAFYSTLQEHTSPSGGLDFAYTAESLHSATKKMRDKGLSSLLWGAYIHCGI